MEFVSVKNFYNLHKDKVYIKVTKMSATDVKICQNFKDCGTKIENLCYAFSEKCKEPCNKLLNFINKVCCCCIFVHYNKKQKTLEILKELDGSIFDSNDLELQLEIDTSPQELKAGDKTEDNAVNTPECKNNDLSRCTINIPEDYPEDYSDVNSEDFNKTIKNPENISDILPEKRSDDVASDCNEDNEELDDKTNDSKENLPERKDFQVEDSENVSDNEENEDNGENEENEENQENKENEENEENEDGEDGEDGGNKKGKDGEWILA